MNPAKVGLAVSSGLSMVCATCQKYWTARERGIPEPKCLAVDGCCSPIGGGDFHEYEGPITDFARWCFVCGLESRYGIKAGSRPRVVGVCSDHVKWLAELEPVDVPNAVGLEIVNGHGSVNLARLMRRPKSLAQTIYEVEKTFADKEGKR